MTSPTAPTAAWATLATSSLALPAVRAPLRAALAPASAAAAPAFAATAPTRSPALLTSPALGKLRDNAEAACTRTSASTARPISVPAILVICAPKSFMFRGKARVAPPLRTDARLRAALALFAALTLLALLTLLAALALLAAFALLVLWAVLAPFALLAALAEPRAFAAFFAEALPCDRELAFDPRFAAPCFLACFAMCSTPDLG